MGIALDRIYQTTSHSPSVGPVVRRADVSNETLDVSNETLDRSIALGLGHKASAASERSSARSRSFRRNPREKSLRCHVVFVQASVSNVVKNHEIKWSGLTRRVPIVPTMVCVTLLSSLVSCHPFMFGSHSDFKIFCLKRRMCLETSKPAQWHARETMN